MWAHPPSLLCLSHHTAQVIEAALEDAGMDKSQIDWLVMHQANMRIMASAAERLGVPTGRRLMSLVDWLGVSIGWAGEQKTVFAGPGFARNPDPTRHTILHLSHPRSPPPPAPPPPPPALHPLTPTPIERVVSNLSDYGNTSAASIPLALDEAVRRGDIQPGAVLAMAGFGAGLSWASAIVRWG